MPLCKKTATSTIYKIGDAHVILGFLNIGPSPIVVGISIIWLYLNDLVIIHLRYDGLVRLRVP